MTNQDLTRLCSEWQSILRLQDWQVIIQFARHWELDDNRAGTVRFLTSKKAAFIKILDPQDISPDWTFPFDIELTIVHELLHLHTVGFTDEQPVKHEEVAEEQMIHALSVALFNFKRELDHLTSSPRVKKK